MRIKVSPPAPAGGSARCGDPRRASFDGGDIIFLAGKEQESAGISLSGSA